MHALTAASRDLPFGTLVRVVRVRDAIADPASSEAVRRFQHDRAFLFCYPQYALPDLSRARRLLAALRGVCARHAAPRAY